LSACHTARGENEKKRKKKKKKKKRTCEEDGLIASCGNGFEPLAPELVEGCGLSLVGGFRKPQLVVVVASPHKDGDWWMGFVFCEGQFESLLLLCSALGVGGRLRVGESNRSRRHLHFSFFVGSIVSSSFCFRLHLTQQRKR